MDGKLECPVARNAVQEAPLDVRQVMELAEKIDSFEQISRQLDRRLPGTEPVPSIRLASELHLKAGEQISNAKQPTSLALQPRHLHSLPRRISIFSVYLNSFSIVYYLSISMSILEYF